LLEIGCGKGDFLADVAELGVEAAVGIDPGFLPDRVARSGDRLTFIRDSFDERYAHLTADLIVTRHLFEHLPRPRQMLELIRRSAEATPDGALFTELPDARRVLREGAFWDIYYEHCSYFTLGSLGRLLRSCGFRQESMRLGFGDQYLLAWSALADDPGPHPAEEPAGVVLDEIDRFARTVDDEIRRWLRYLGAADEAGEPVVIWGGGSKAVAFATTVGLAGADVTVVDINPHKQGKWLAGTSLQVHDPGRVVDIDPRHVIVMNPIYREEIRSQLSRMGLSPNIVTV
jgi:SAM-dependent methyltransferase